MAQRLSVFLCLYALGRSNYLCRSLSVFLSHIFPVAARHIAELLARVDALANADGLEIGTPELLEKCVVAAEYVGIKLSVGEVEGDGCFVFEGDADSPTPVFSP